MTPRAKKPISRRLTGLTRPIRHALTVPLLEAARIAVAPLPYRWALRLGRALGVMTWLLAFGYRRRVARQLRQAGLIDNPQQAGRRTREVFRMLGMVACESLHAMRWSDEEFRRRVVFDRPDIIEAAHATGRGVLFVSAHTDNWELTMRGYYVHFGRPLASVMATGRNRRLNEWIVRGRRSAGTQIISDKNALTGMIRQLRRGGQLALMGDQDSTRQPGVFVDFFGRPALTPTGPAQLARRTGAVLLPALISRDPGNSLLHTIHIGEPIEPDADADEPADLLRMTKAFTEVLERLIRLYPTQWVWIHDRWRHRPGEKIKIRKKSTKIEGKTTRGTPK